jgi:hypothetical protein
MKKVVSCLFLLSFVFINSAIAKPKDALCDFASNKPGCNEAPAEIKNEPKLEVTKNSDGITIIKAEDWTLKDINLPWNQVVLDQSWSENNYVVFTKSFKFKVGFLEPHKKERIHARWTQNQVEIFVMRGRSCGLVGGCLSSDSYLLPKRIRLTVEGQNYFLVSSQANTYEVTTELKNILANIKTETTINVRLDERINFELKLDAVKALSQLMNKNIAQENISTK